mmetsp:Transcript_14749/g.48172  ORF Transcript_14749/g.48172 Transcript_14749/m.48172 type:complete len:454 (-) Transcript_14749:344-1705(-)
MAVAIGKGLGPAVGSYARARKQFKVPIADFGGVQEALAMIASDGYVSLASTETMNAIVDSHEAPMVLSSIMKQNVTERGRVMINHGMDILGGAGISMGRDNLAGPAYASIPIAITVEGANVMTRSFQIIGQGLMRCHPHLLDVVEALEASDKDAPARFLKGVGKMAGHGFSNFRTSLTLGLSQSLVPGFLSKKDFVQTHEARLKRLAANFALAADLALLLGGRLKFEEMFMGRLADCLGATFLGYSVLVHYAQHADKADAGLRLVAEHAMLRLEKEAHDALLHAADNVPKMPLGFHVLAGSLIRTAVKPIGISLHEAPSDTLTKDVSDLLTTLKSTYANEFLVPAIYTSDGIRKTLMDALPVCLQADDIALKLRKEKREPTSAEAQIIKKADDFRDAIVQVASYDHLGAVEQQEGYVRPAIAQTQDWLANGIGAAVNGDNSHSKVHAAASSSN